MSAVVASGVLGACAVMGDGGCQADRDQQELVGLIVDIDASAAFRDSVSCANDSSSSGDFVGYFAVSDPGQFVALAESGSRCRPGAKGAGDRSNARIIECMTGTGRAVRITVKDPSKLPVEAVLRASPQ